MKVSDPIKINLELSPALVDARELSPEAHTRQALGDYDPCEVSPEAHARHLEDAREQGWERAARAEVGRALGLNPAPSWCDVRDFLYPNLTIKLGEMPDAELAQRVRNMQGARRVTNAIIVDSSQPLPYVVPLVDGARRQIGSASILGERVVAFVRDPDAIAKLVDGVCQVSVGYAITETAGVVEPVTDAPVSLDAVDACSVMRSIEIDALPGLAANERAERLPHTINATISRTLEIYAERRAARGDTPPTRLGDQVVSAIKAIVELIATGDR